MKLITIFAATAMLVSGASAMAATPVSVTATGSGWINAGGTTNSGGFDRGVHNTYTQDGSYNDYFDFAAIGQKVSAATLNIWSNQNNSAYDPTAVYSVHAPSAFTYAGLANGASLGSVTGGVADTGTGHYVGITLDALGVAYLNAHSSTAVHFGGTATGNAQFFGYTTGYPVATLTVTPGVPEPATWSMLVSGFGLVGVMTRRRAKAVCA